LKIEKKNKGDKRKKSISKNDIKICGDTIKTESDVNLKMLFFAFCLLNTWINIYRLITDHQLI